MIWLNLFHIIRKNDKYIRHWSSLAKDSLKLSLDEAPTEWALSVFLDPKQKILKIKTAAKGVAEWTLEAAVLK